MLRIMILVKKILHTRFSFDAASNSIAPTAHSQERAHIYIAIILLLYSLATFFNLYDRYLNLEMREPTDSAAYMQAAWSILHGDPFTVSVQESFFSYYKYNFLGDQLMFTLLLFVPLLLIPAFPVSGLYFLVTQVAIISFGAFLLYRYAAKYIENGPLSVLIALCFLVNPATTYSFQLFGFRAETLFIPIIFGMFYLLQSQKTVWASICLILLVLTKHNAILIGVLIGLYILIFERKIWRFGLFCTIFSVVYYMVGVKEVMTHLQENPTAYFKHFAIFGKTASDAAIYMILHPGEIISMISDNEIAHVRHIFFPVGLLALLHPLFYISSSELLINAVLPDYHSIFCGWHWTIVLPFMFLGVVRTIAWFLSKTTQDDRMKGFIASLLVFQIIFHASSVIPQDIQEHRNFYYRINNIDTSNIITALSIIEPNASVMASGQLLWFLFDRAEIYTSRVKFHDKVDYIVMALPMGHPHYRNIDKFMLEEIGIQQQAGHSKFSNFHVVTATESMLILKRQYKGP